MKIEALRSHMSGGILILVLMLVRLFVRSQTRIRFPPRPAIRSSIASPGPRPDVLRRGDRNGRMRAFMAVQAGLFALLRWRRLRCHRTSGFSRCARFIRGFASPDGLIAFTSSLPFSRRGAQGWIAAAHVLRTPRPEDECHRSHPNRTFSGV